MEQILAPGLTVRPARRSDLHDVFVLITETDTHVQGSPEYEESEIVDVWRTASLDDDVRIIEDAGARIVGYALAIDHNVLRPTAFVYTHPDAVGRGIGTWLARWVEERARTKLHRAPEDARVALEATTVVGYAPASDLLVNEGYKLERYFLRMTIDLHRDTPLPTPSWPDGITLRNLIPGADDQAVFEAIDEAFTDHWGHVRPLFNDWRDRLYSRQWFEPALWFLAMAGDEIAGVAICQDYPVMNQGWVHTLGVRRPWRRTGVALALLHHAFGEFHRRGRRSVALGVDAQSLTGATRVYERAGMRMSHRFALYAKELRPGVDLAVRELTA